MSSFYFRLERGVNMNNNNIRRCAWIEGKPNYYVKYHDEIWGKAEYNDQALFKWLSLEIFHIGLSWQLVLSKYGHFTEAFDDFHIDLVAAYDEAKIDELMQNEKIIRYRKKIEAVIHNAKQLQKIQEEYSSFSAYIWSFTDGEQVVKQTNESITQSELSEQVTKSLKEYDFKFIGSVTIYSYLQAIGIVNDHDLACTFR